MTYVALKKGRVVATCSAGLFVDNETLQQIGGWVVDGYTVKRRRGPVIIGHRLPWRLPWR